jgi:ankyrin repeat protein
MITTSSTSKAVAALALAFAATSAPAQIPPSASQLASYEGLFAAAARGDIAGIKAATAQGKPVDARDDYKRTPLHVAAYRSQIPAMRALVAAGADPNALENDRYDIITIASVANDLPTLKAALEIGCKATNITSRYDGTALIAAAHLGHAEVVRELIRAGAPLNHVNNLGWTAVIEAIVLGDGGANHQATLKHLIDARADLNLADRNGTRPLGLARGRGYAAMVKMLEAAGAR